MAKQEAKKPDGTLRLPKVQALKWCPWFIEQARTCGLGPESGIVRFAAVVKADFDSIGDKPGIAWPMSESFKLTLVDFHRVILRDSLHPLMGVLATCWRGVGQTEPEVPPDELRRARIDLAQPYVEVPFKPVEPVVEVKAKGSLFV